MAHSRWLDRADELTKSFISAFDAANSFEMVALSDGLFAIGLKDKRRAVAFGHPLWRHDQQFWVPEQAAAESDLLNLGYQGVEMSDLYLLETRPYEVWTLLQ